MQSVTILLQMLLVLGRVANATTDAERKQHLLQHAGLVADTAGRTVPERYGRLRINDQLVAVRVRESLSASVTELPPLSPECDSAAT